MLKDNLIMLRNIRGLSQEEVAEAVGISRQAYGKWESGLTIPDIEKCHLLAKRYGVSIDSLIKEEAIDGLGPIPPAPIGKSIWGTVTVNDRGQIVIPKGARDRFGIKSGSQLIICGDEIGIALIPMDTFEEELGKIMKMAYRDADKQSE